MCEVAAEDRPDLLFGEQGVVPDDGDRIFRTHVGGIVGGEHDAVSADRVDKESQYRVRMNDGVEVQPRQVRRRQLWKVRVLFTDASPPWSNRPIAMQAYPPPCAKTIRTEGNRSRTPPKISDASAIVVSVGFPIRLLR